MSIEITEHEPGGDLDDFVQVAYEIYRTDPAWVAPLQMEVRERLSPSKNPFFEHAECALFTARKDGNLVGRISAQIDHEHLRAHGDNAGFFGFFDTIDDQEVADALLATAEEWLASRGMSVMRGPFSLSINEEPGLLVEGFDSPPVLMCPHHRSYQGALAEGAGLAKVQDLFGWMYKVEPPPPRAEKAWQTINSMPEVRFRPIRPRALKREIGEILDIFNDAWQDNWGFVPSTDAEARKMAKDLALIMDKRLSFFVEVDGQAVAMCVCLPNLNEAIRDFDGKLNPVTISKLLWRLKARGLKSARLMLLGIRKNFRGSRRYAPLSTALYAEIARRGIKAGYEWAELGWTLEDNRLISAGIKAMRAHVYKVYRLYEKAISV
ncbi:MAG: hypothetical protein O7F08_08420 [Deltaproteobacteria bacterium]|nr:hypothetical protein [Deltaproteobacteria bacterium]